MSTSKLALSVLLATFLGVTAIVIAQHGYLGFFELAMANSATLLLSLDLVISLSLISIWMLGDARERGGSVVAYLLITLTFGAAGPLLYLIRRPALDMPPSLRHRSSVEVSALEAGAHRDVCGG